jgi:hypothetical protein
MAFDPNLPANDAPLDAGEMRNQLNSLKAFIGTQAMQVAVLTTQLAALNAEVSVQANLVPIGAVIAWFKDTPGVPALTANFVECNGQILNDPESPLNGQFIPDLNTGLQRFLRGGLISGQLGGIDSFATAQADNAGVGTPLSFVTIDFSPGAQPFPPYVTAVHLVRVK